MAQNVIVSDRQTRTGNPYPQSEANSSGVSWAAVIGGAFAAAALSLVLLALGTGLGMSSVSPWSNVGASASTISKAAIAWLIIMQIVSSAMGGYVAGRLRTKWTAIHTDEVYFRDTAHGFLVWAVGIVLTASFLASAAASLVGGTAQAGATGSASAGSSQIDAASADPNGYFIDAFFRSDRPNTNANDAATRAEVGRILTRSLRRDGITDPDKRYMAQLVAAKTGLSEPEAEKRVSDVELEARQAADATRKAVAHLSIWLFIALLIGAFSASYAATIGGRQRDHMKLA
jgi:hypothetical protein